MCKVRIVAATTIIVNTVSEFDTFWFAKSTKKIVPQQFEIF
jgi:hypothetical protein